MTLCDPAISLLYQRPKCRWTIRPRLSVQTDVESVGFAIRIELQEVERGTIFSAHHAGCSLADDNTKSQVERRRDAQFPGK